MGLIETLTLVLGPAVAKGIAKFWLKDSEFGKDLATSLVDFIKSKTPDVIAQQRAKRQFEAIGEKVAQSLLPVFEAEGASLDEGARVSIALAVQKTLEQARITPELLAERNLDPTSLAEHLRHSHPTATRDYTEAETSLYDRIIDEVSRDIVDIAADLPGFNEHTFAEVLKRENELIQKTDRILLEVGRIREESLRVNPKLEAARFEEAYLRDVARKLDQLELFGIDVTRANRRHSLNVAYVTLSVETKRTKETGEPAAAHETLPPEDEDAEDEEARDVVSVDEAVAEARCLLIRGPAGSGKTTLLQWVAVQSASRRFEGDLDSWNDTIPFFIRLRQCVESGLPRPEEYVRLVTPAIAGTMPEGWVHEQLDSGRACVLVDGVDEVPTAQKTSVHEWVRELVGAYPQARFMITSRPYAVEEGWLAREGFDEAELQEMEPGDIAEFIDHWHDAVAQALEDQEERDLLPRRAEKLKEVIRQNRSIRNLATTPLLCAMLCALNRERETELPSDRIELYDAACYALVERRDPERGLTHLDYPRLTYRQKLALLEDLAYWLLNNDWAQVALDKVDQRLERKLANMAALPPDATAESVRRLLVERSVIVREPQKAQMDFAHRTFQEYLAAKAALDEGDTGVLVKCAHDDKWRETIILAAGRASMKVRGELINSLIVRGDKETERRQQLHLLAVGCLETAVELAGDVKEEVDKRLAKLVPPRNITEAKALAPAGELLIPHLLDASGYKAPVAAACVRTLGLVGGPAALSALAGYFEDTRGAVIQELLKASSLFDTKEFTDRVFTGTNAKANALAVRGPLSSLHGVKCYVHIPSLTVNRLGRISDLGPLAALCNLESLELDSCPQLSSLAPLAGLFKLTFLSLCDCPQLADLSPLAALNNLTRLELMWCKRLSDVSPLAALGKLTTLELVGCSEVRDLSPLATLKNLTELDLSLCRKDLDVSPLKGLEKLHIARP